MSAGSNLISIMLLVLLPLLLKLSLNVCEIGLLVCLFRTVVVCSAATPKQIGEIHKNDDHGISNQVGHRMTLIKNNLVNYKIVTIGNCQLCNKLRYF